MTNEPSSRHFYLQEPPYVSEIIPRGFYGRIALLRDDPSRVFKFCCRDREEAVVECKVLNDLFSLGYLLYEMLMGNMPYKDLEEPEVWDLYTDHVFPPLDDISPRGFAEVIRKCWDEEYPSVCTLQSDLDNIICDPSVTNEDVCALPKVPHISRIGSLI